MKKYAKLNSKIMLTFCLILCSLTSFCTCTTIEAIFSLDVCCQTWHSRYDSTPSIFFNWNKKISCYDHSNELKHIAETPPFKLFVKFQKYRDKKTLPESKTTRRLSFQKQFNDCCWTCFSCYIANNFEFVTKLPSRHLPVHN